MRPSLIAFLMAKAAAKPKSALPAHLRRPLYIRRDSDGKFFYRQPNSLYRNDEDSSLLPSNLVIQILRGDLKGYTVSPQDAPDFHPEPSSFIIDGHAS